MEVQGYAIIKSGADITTAGDVKDFINRPLRVMEWAVDGGALVLNSQGDALAMVEESDIVKSFKCSESGLYVCPPGLNFLGRTQYSIKCMDRKGGYDAILRALVVTRSLMKGEFDDSFLWS